MKFTSTILAMISAVAVMAAPSTAGDMSLAIRSDGLFEAMPMKRGELMKDAEDACLVRRSDGLFEKRQCGCYCKKDAMPVAEAIYVKRSEGLYARVPCHCG